MTTPRVGSKPSDIGIKPTISGPVLAPVGKLMWGLPLGSTTRAVGSIAVVVTPEGSVHVLRDTGAQVVEILCDARLREQLRDRVAPR